MAKPKRRKRSVRNVPGQDELRAITRTNQAGATVLESVKALAKEAEEVENNIVTPRIVEVVKKNPDAWRTFALASQLMTLAFTAEALEELGMCEDCNGVGQLAYFIRSLDGLDDEVKERMVEDSQFIDSCASMFKLNLYLEAPEEIKAVLNKYHSIKCSDPGAYEKVKAVNAELLEAVKALLASVGFPSDTIKLAELYNRAQTYLTTVNTMLQEIPMLDREQAFAVLNEVKKVVQRARDLLKQIRVLGQGGSNSSSSSNSSTESG